MADPEHQDAPKVDDVEEQDIPGGFEQPREEPKPTVVEDMAEKPVPIKGEESNEAKAEETVKAERAVQVDEEALSPPVKELGDPEEPHLLVIESLRAQTADLISQVTQLNAKLVKSYDRVSDLEDDIHVSSQNLRAAKLKVTALELERTEHLSALNTGLLVEREHVTQELKSMMERVSDEAAQRGQAESAKQAIEKDLDDLSATLFSQANSMVAEARLDRARSARRLAECEEALKGAEEVVTMVQQQMQDLREQKEKSDREVERMKEVMGKGKYVEKEKEVVILPLRLMNAHLPYKEFMDFIIHLRGVKPTTPSPPPIHTLLTLPFLARLISEDTDSTVRFDLAPSLNWLTRRSFTTAIQQGLLLIEPLHTSSLQVESASILTFSSSSEVLCGLCGGPVFGHSSRTPGASSSLPSTNSYAKATPPATNTTSSWATSRFLKSNPLASLNNTRASTPNATALSTPPPTPLPDAIIHVFRLSTPPSQKPASPYPLCQSGWCLARLRTTCELWGFVRRGVIDHVWEDDTPVISTATPPAVPPRKRMASRIGFWGMGSSENIQAPPMIETSSAPPAHVPLTNGVKPPLPPRRRSETPTTPPAPPVRRNIPPPPKPALMENPPTPGPTENGEAEKPTSDTVEATPEPDTIPEVVEETFETEDVKETAETQEIKEVITEGEDVVIKLQPPKAEEEGATESKLEEPGPEVKIEDAAVEAKNEEAPVEVKIEEPAAEAKTEEASAENPAVNGDRPSTPPSAVSASPTTPMSAPPPIPRRAAARNRGTPTTPTSATPGGSPFKTSATLPPPSPTKEITPASSTEVTPPRVTSDAENDDFLSAPSSPKEKLSPATEREVPPLDIPVSEAKPTVNGVSEHIPEISPVPHSVEEKAHLPPPMPPRRAIPPPKIPNLPVPVSLISLPEEAGFTSDATWEEKAWREVVRLREDMFLARIGAIRADPASVGMMGATAA